MTRGKIVYIDKDCKVFSTIEFNGDMYPDGNASNVIEKFETGYFTSFNNYKTFVVRFNKSYYGYEEELLESFPCYEERVIDVKKNLTDYLYIINDSDQEWIIREKKERLSWIREHWL